MEQYNTKVSGLSIDYNTKYFTINGSYQIKNKDKMNTILNMLLEKEVITNEKKIKSYIRKWRFKNKFRIFKNCRFSR